MKKEFDVWISEALIKGIKAGAYGMYTATPPKRVSEIGIFTVKAKLVVEMPERTAEITESEFEEIVKEVAGNPATWHMTFKRWQQKLFGGKE